MSLPGWMARAVRPLEWRGQLTVGHLERRRAALEALWRTLDTGPVPMLDAQELEPPVRCAPDVPPDLLRRTGALFAAISNALSRAEAVQAVFARQTDRFEVAEVALACFATSREARVRLAAFQAGEQRFPADVPDDPQPYAGVPVTGYAGLVMRGDLPPEIAEAAFSREPAPVVGPVRYDGRAWLVWRLMAPQPVMNEGVYRYCEDLLVEEHLAALV